MQKPWVRVVIGIVAVIAMISGVMKFSQGIREIFGGGESAKVGEHAKAGDTFAEEGNALGKQVGEADELFWPSLDKLGFPNGRDQFTASAETIRDQHKQSAEKFRAAAKEYQSASDLANHAELKNFFAKNAESYRKLAEAQNLLAQRVELALDEKITTADDLLAKMNPLNEQIVAKANEQKELEAQAAKLLEEINAKAKK